MDKIQVHQATELIRYPFELENGQEPESEEALLDFLTQRVAEMMDGRLEHLLSLLYRMDVLEVDIKRVLHPTSFEEPHRALARLVLERQKERILTRQNYKSSEEISEDWKW